MFNTLNTAGMLRQVGEPTAATFRNPFEIVAPRRVRLGLRPQFQSPQTVGDRGVR